MRIKSFAFSFDCKGFPLLIPGEFMLKFRLLTRRSTRDISRAATTGMNTLQLYAGDQVVAVYMGFSV